MESRSQVNFLRKSFELRSKIIVSKSDLKVWLKSEKEIYIPSNLKDRFLQKITNMPKQQIWNYIRLLRKTEYHYNNRVGSIYHSIMYLIVRCMKNTKGLKLGIEITENSCGIGLNICHAGNIVINGYSRLGKNCVLHGSNCIGNTGKQGDVEAPIVGDNVDIGVGSSLIGGIVIADNTTIGAGAVVTHSCLVPHKTLLGVPARAY